MNKYNDKHFDDEIDLRKLFRTLWRGKFYIILSVIASIYLGSLYVQSLEVKYTVTYKLKPVSEKNNSSSASGISSLASLTGMGVTSNLNKDFFIFQELLSSVEVAKIIFDNKANEDLIKGIYKSEWNSSTNDYSKGPKGKIQIIKINLKKFLVGRNNVYSPPNPSRLANFVSSNFDILIDDITGFLEISTETSDPALMILLGNELTKVSDNIMRQRYIDFSTEPLAFYKEKLRTARAREHRESLAQLIADEEQKLMLASRGKYFVAEPYLKPSLSLHPTSPRSTMILFVFLILGLIFGIIISLIFVKKVEDN